MILRILWSTDKKFIGFKFNKDEPILLGSFKFLPTKLKEIGNNLIQLSNSNYVVITEPA